MGALLIDHTYELAGWLAIVGGVFMIIAGLVMARAGFSRLAMAINMSASSVMLVWMMTVGVLMWRRDGMIYDS